VRRLVLLAGVVTAIVLWRRRRVAEYVDVTYDDGSFVRLERGVEAVDLLDDARELLRTLAA
jgi:hypothetical protein